jgi:hypothetical protein
MIEVMFQEQIASIIVKNIDIIRRGLFHQHLLIYERII